MDRGFSEVRAGRKLGLAGVSNSRWSWVTATKHFLLPRERMWPKSLPSAWRATRNLWHCQVIGFLVTLPPITARDEKNLQTVTPILLPCTPLSRVQC